MASQIDPGRNAWRDPGKPRAYRTDKICKGKQFYPDEIAARAGGALSIEELGNRDRLWCYRCAACCGWHLTSRNQGRRFLITVDGRVPDQKSDQQRKWNYILNSLVPIAEC